MINANVVVYPNDSLRRILQIPLPISRVPNFFLLSGDLVKYCRRNPAIVRETQELIQTQSIGLAGRCPVDS